MLACVRRGLSVRQGNLKEGLADYPDGSFDCVILAQTLQYLGDQTWVLGEMLRVGAGPLLASPTGATGAAGWSCWPAVASPLRPTYRNRGTTPCAGKR